MASAIISPFPSALTGFNAEKLHIAATKMALLSLDWVRPDWLWLMLFCRCIIELSRLKVALACC
jgi:hypothetical protein